MAPKLLLLLCLFSGLHARSRKVEEDEYEDSSSNQKWVLAPKSQDTDVTLILNKLLREYDKKLRPDIGTQQLVNLHPTLATPFPHVFTPNRPVYLEKDLELP
ncbi:Gamma-aminobutyric acid receptor subunit gamma-3 [Fukomys damarensis]|uniref:Gamma-aminobutyric acid receptor subunit gamma-3 n=1 Tax=Fukomys damarensis TaxID=885580 RepID=A0A091CQZ6_FUKDA|nr:Gamma-aminobutyric acid receptor subunit gamma-3 [Fukomys damarensis]